MKKKKPDFDNECELIERLRKICVSFNVPVLYLFKRGAVPLHSG